MDLLYFMGFEHLQDAVNSLEQEINETQKKYEETSKLTEDRLNQAMDAESKIIDLKIDMQRSYDDTLIVFYKCYFFGKLIIILFQGRCKGLMIILFF